MSTAPEPVAAVERAPFDPIGKGLGDDGEPCPRVRTGCANSSTRRRRRSTCASRWRSGCWPAGFTELAEGDAWPGAGDFFTVRAGSLVAWRAGAEPGVPFRVVGAHTDSPNLRVKQHPDRFVSGWQVVALQPYGGAWLNSWLDRDLGISGRLSVRSGGRPRAPIDPDRRADPAGAAAGDPPGRGPQVGVAGPAAARQRGVGRGQRSAVVRRSTSPSRPEWTRTTCSVST